MRRSLLWIAISIVSISMVAVFSLAGCKEGGGQEVGEEEEEVAEEEVMPTLAWVPKTLDNPVFDTGGRAFQKAGEDIGFEAIWTGPTEADAAQQLTVMEDLISKGVDGIAVSVTDAGIIGAGIDEAMEAGIDTITFDSDAPDSKRIAYYGTNNYQGGVELAKLIAEALDGEGQIAILTGKIGMPNLDERIEGVEDTIAADYPNIEIISTQLGETDMAKSVEVVESFTLANPDLDGWIMVGGWPLFTPVGSMPIMEEKAIAGELAVVAFDTLLDQLDYVKEGSVYALVGQKYYGWGYDSGQILYDIVVNGKTFDDPFLDTGVDVVTKDGGEGRISADEMAEKWETGNF